MRLQQLDLLRYGKFTDRSLAFPRAERDFHLIVGMNEAGKSTTRSAILDLLYGIETRSTYDFLHAKAEMRLGATLAHGDAALAFVRTKVRNKALLRPDGQPLPDAALGPFLGGTERGFFDQMFGLDHPRLVAGSKAILDSANDIGQILFQSAAGIGSLGVVREQLESEADGLWGRRKSNDRAYYIAGEQLAQAEAALKQATVRTRDWVDARTRVEELEERREALRERHGALEAERLRLERVRRVASALRRLREKEAELAALGDVVLLPADAAAQLAQAELALAAAERDRELFDAQAAQALSQLQRLRPDERLLRHADDIARLVERRQQVRNHGRDIERRRLEIDVHWQQAVAAARQLGWRVAGGQGDDQGSGAQRSRSDGHARGGADDGGREREEALAQRLPAQPVRAAVMGLLRRAPVLEQARRAAQASASDKAAELAALQAQRGALSLATVPAPVRAALSAARALGDVRASLARDEAQRRKAERELAAAQADLGAWSADAPTLRPLALPTEAQVGARLRRDAEDALALDTLAKDQDRLASEVELLRLDIDQYRSANRPVSWAELGEARARRDAAWAALRPTGATASASLLLDDTTCRAYESHVGLADDLADQRHDKAREASELQARLDALERLQLQLADVARRLDARRAARESASDEWVALTRALGLAGLPLQEFEAWRGARERVLRAHDACVEAGQSIDATRAAEDTVARDLREALAGAGIAFDAAAPLGAAVLVAADAVERAAATRARAEQLESQQALLAAALDRQRDAAALADAAFEAWTAEWRTVMRAVGLPEDCDIAVAESALALFADIDGKLDSIRDLRRNRIDAMRADLADFAREVAQVLVVAIEAVAPGPGEGEPDAAVAELGARLEAARAERREADRLRDELVERETQAVAAASRVAAARDALQPLLRQAYLAAPGGDDGNHAALRELIERSDRHRRIAVDLDAAASAVEEGGDGLAPEVLEAEVAALDAASIPARMGELALETEAVREARDALTVQITQADAALSRIAGQDDAARAEADRQNALAAMANAAERYVRVHTAARLLKWAIDRYRETRQGPLLGRAGAIFAALTCGSFQKLSVDFDSHPLALHGLRADGQTVPITGMSDGTRDQLYLALRLAALEMHLAQSHAMPFIADDLFINYDDGRSTAGLEALAELSTRTQVIFLTHHDHLVPRVRKVFGEGVNVVTL